MSERVLDRLGRGVIERHHLHRSSEPGLQASFEIADSGRPHQPLEEGGPGDQEPPTPTSSWRAYSASSKWPSDAAISPSSPNVHSS